MIAGRKYIGTQVDAWSCGIILFALICGFLPFEDPDTTELYKKILKGQYHIPSFVSKDARDLIKSIMIQDPKKRATPPQIRAHPWFQNTYKPVNASKGLIVGHSHMLYEEAILQKLEQKGFERDKIVRYLDANKHNHDTTCYYLILKKMEREGEIDKRKYFSGENILASTPENSEKGKDQRSLSPSERTRLLIQKQYLSQNQIDKNMQI